MKVLQNRPLLSPCTAENIYHCNKCGLCLSVCPVYREVLVESASPRGKVQLARHILEGDLGISERMKEILSRCLLCGSCVAACPSGVHGDHLFSGLRWRAIQRYGIDWKRRILFQILAHRWMASTSAWLSAWSRKAFGPAFEVFGKRGQEGFLKGIPIDRIPSFHFRPFSSGVPERIPSKGETKARVLYFHGCATEYLYGTVGHAVVDVLSRIGVEVRIPRGQGCCGIPIFLSGAREMALEGIRAVLKDFAQGEEAVIVDCATCGLALKREYPHMLREIQELGGEVEEGLVASAERLALKTRDVMEFIGEHLDWLPEAALSPGPSQRVTYHDPCHLLKGQGVGSLPRMVLKGLSGLDFVEMEGADECCGGGGSFQVEHPKVSRGITARKVEHIRRTQAEVVATGCPGCRLTIGLHLPGDPPIPVLHPVELVRWAMDKGHYGREQ